MNVTEGAPFAFIGLHHVQLAIPPDGEEDARAFYGEVLGLSEVVKPPDLASRGGCWFRGQGIELHLGVEEKFVPARKAHPGILLDRIGPLSERLIEHGFEVDWDRSFPGYRRFYSYDLHGNRLEFLERSFDRNSGMPNGFRW